MERKTRVELATSSLARRRSTTELLPPEAWPSIARQGRQPQTGGCEALEAGSSLDLHRRYRGSHGRFDAH